MTKKKPRKAKMGRKSRRLKKYQDGFLKLFFDAGDVTPWNASILVGCSYEYALRKYKEFFWKLTPAKWMARRQLQYDLGYAAKF